MITLPTEKVKAKTGNPKITVLFGKPKSGKTSFVSSIENNLIIDLEEGSLYLDALAVQAKTIDNLRDIVSQLKESIKENNIFMYKYITIDSGTALEEIARDYALKLYQKTPTAKRKDGSLFNDDILTLPNGGGYYWLREAFEKMYKPFISLCENLIIICHCKDKLINDNGKELSEMSMDLTGKIARILSSKADAIGYVYRKKNKTVINFNGGGDTICESRCNHLRGKEIVVAESDENNNLTFYPERIFLPE